MVTSTDGLSCDVRETLVPLMAFRTEGLDRDAEREARRLLERLGAVELSCVDDVRAARGLRRRLRGDRRRRRAHLLWLHGPRPHAVARPGLERRGRRRLPLPCRRGRAHLVRPRRASRRAARLVRARARRRGQRHAGRPAARCCSNLLDRLDAEGGLDALASSCRSKWALKVSDTHHVMRPGRPPARAAARRGRAVPGRAPRGCGRSPRCAPPRSWSSTRAFERAGARIEWTDDSGVHRARARAHPAPGRTPRPGLQATLRPYQSDGVDFLQRSPRPGAAASSPTRWASARRSRPSPTSASSASRDG